MALGVLTAPAPQLLQLLAGLDAFGHHLELHVVRQHDDRPEDLEVFLACAHPGDEGAVDLEEIDRVAVQLGER